MGADYIDVQEFLSKRATHTFQKEGGGWWIRIFFVPTSNSSLCNPQKNSHHLPIDLLHWLPCCFIQPTSSPTSSPKPCLSTVEELTGALHLVDLAGSERLDKSLDPGKLVHLGKAKKMGRK